jgi:hypothetical protein
MTTSRTVVLLTALLLLGSAGCHRKTQEERGREDAANKANYIKGVGEGLKKEGEAAAQSLGEGVGKVVKSASGGVSGGYFTFNIEIAGTALGKGLKISRAEQRRQEKSEESRTITAYILADQGYSGSLRLVALDSTRQEVGRATTKATLETGDAKYIDFKFDIRTPMKEVKTIVLQTL